MRIHRTSLGLGGVLALAAALSACAGGHGSSAAAPGGTRGTSSTRSATPAATETNPAGDIPDSQVYVPFRYAGLFTVKVPEGWARRRDGSATVFTDKLNTVRVQRRQAAKAPTRASASAELPHIRAAVHGFKPGSVTRVRRGGGPAVRITYRAESAPNPVTGKRVPDAVERYEYWKGGTEAVLTLSGPVGADNVDPWKTISDSLRWR